MTIAGRFCHVNSEKGEMWNWKDKYKRCNWAFLQKIIDVHIPLLVISIILLGIRMRWVRNVDDVQDQVGGIKKAALLRSRDSQSKAMI